MLDASQRRILERLGAGDVVLDVGGWAEPFERADWILDLMPYETRPGADPGRERFTAETWVRRDMCDREPWPFAADFFAFAVCSHTLEDVRDPIWVCAELSRVAKAGYVEVPSRMMEQAVGIQGPWAGYGHHHWLVEVVEGGLEFVFKSHVLDGDPRFQLPASAFWQLPEKERVQALFWEGEIRARERIFIGHEEHDAWLASIVETSRPRGLRERLRGR